MTGEKILVVEDSVITSTLIKKTLLSMGYQVVAVVDNGPESIEKARILRPDLVLMDIILKGTMTGIEAAKKIRETLGIPVVYLTAQSDDATVNDAIMTEPFGYLIKPLEERSLKTTIQMAFYKHAMDEKLRERENTISVLLNGVPDALALLNRGHEIVAVNESMAEKLGMKSGELVGTTVENLNHEGTVRILKEFLRDLHGTGKPVWFEEKQKDRWFETVMYPITNSSGAIIRIAVQSHDITDWKQLESELKTEGLSQIESNMEEFQILNDQIRNPLQAIRGYLALSSDTGCKNKIEEQIMIINNLVNRLDKGWVESEKVRSFLIRHYRHGEQIMTKHRYVGVQGSVPE
ncbi:response regulator [uncultured Methanoregula sp.]|uniref:ATP-binding response regulator n=1 Tax=uncultured Methanoregula sp. TaxID=1005933 RepID=UPI002AAAD427|nr:response regulator [uncultured Methanoregula sp.]